MYTFVSGGIALQGLTTTAPPGLDNVMCPSNASSALDCSFNSPPVSPQCYGNFSAAGVRCIQGILYYFLFCCHFLSMLMLMSRAVPLHNKWGVHYRQCYI